MCDTIGKLSRQLVRTIEVFGTNVQGCLGSGYACGHTTPVVQSLNMVANADYINSKNTLHSISEVCVKCNLNKSFCCCSHRVLFLLLLIQTLIIMFLIMSCVVCHVVLVTGYIL